ncbi:FolC bifunctional protein [Fictibacillus macauensis ZFHKF-1]|uniref:tetrahydrofolate synthase n=1 Tax=Fictibacillus macauensis ZFHKF-1 TaxID=1196324 RepID=I8AHY6_9BACL|nr:folylpolyglutamate synthase/dihydrofolate synthase family protein [Fictibacillus macauensis]EIT85347.1 FolC bifunctional protein [Fictibacillus macauensis ZFHKF-1]
MFQTYDDVNRFLQLEHPGEMKMGLERMRAVLQKMQHPEKKLTCIHVAGTNGKGSVIAMLHAIFKEAGYTVGTFTSPYLECVTDHIHYQGEAIPHEKLQDILHKLKQPADEVKKEGYGSLSEFEAMTAAAFLYFAEEQPDICLIEAGLGGLTDATNVITPLVSVITSIGYDHMNILGRTLAEIAHHKAGIIKEGVPVITAVKKQEPKEVIINTAKKVAAPLECAGMTYQTERTAVKQRGQEVFYVTTQDDKKGPYPLSMLGAHQVDNAGIVVMTIEALNRRYGFTISEEALTNGLQKASWSGRFEYVAAPFPLLVDGAHNPESMTALLQTLRDHAPKTRFHILFGALQDKDVHEMLTPLEEVALSITFTDFSHHRAQKGEMLRAQCSLSETYYEKDWHEAIRRWLQKGSQTEPLLLTGSLYFIAEVRSYLLQKISEMNV